MSDDNECAPIHPEPIKPEPLPIPDGGKQTSVVVDELPEEGESGVIYWLMKEGSDAYDLYQWVGDDWRKIDVDISLYSTTGANTDGAMTQKATTEMVFADYSNNDAIRINKNAYTYSYPMPAGCVSIGAGGNFNARNCVLIGKDADASSDDVIAIGRNSTGSYGSVSVGLSASSYNHSVAIGENSKTKGASLPYSTASTALGYNASAPANGAVALGAYSSSTTAGEMNIGSTNTAYGYASSNYRLLTGLYDPQSAHDAATKGYVDTLVGNIESALNVINNGGES